jgi:hypothetical protein
VKANNFTDCDTAGGGRRLRIARLLAGVLRDAHLLLLLAPAAEKRKGLITERLRQERGYGHRENQSYFFNNQFKILPVADFVNVELEAVTDPTQVGLKQKK